VLRRDFTQEEVNRQEEGEEMKTEAELKVILDEKMADYEEPDNKQLANFAAVTISGGIHQAGQILSMFETMPTLREVWLKAHRTFQEDAYLLAIAVEDVNDEMMTKLGLTERLEGRNEI
jgi:hypothetical protein